MKSSLYKQQAAPPTKMSGSGRGKNVTFQQDSVVRGLKEEIRKFLRLLTGLPISVARGFLCSPIPFTPPPPLSEPRAYCWVLSVCARGPCVLLPSVGPQRVCRLAGSSKAVSQRPYSKEPAQPHSPVTWRVFFVGWSDMFSLPLLASSFLSLRTSLK